MRGTDDWVKRAFDKQKQQCVYEYIDKNSTDTIKIKLIVNASSADKKNLEAVENKNKGEFADRYGKLVLNKIQSKQNKKD